ncbi:MAG: ABC transporter permease [Solirubrobacteraceae bacterium]
MSAPPPRALRSAGAIASVYLAEQQKLLAQLATRLLALVCVAGPFAFAGVLKAQSGTPSDALFGVWVHSTGFAISLVVLGFAGSWGFPLMAGVLAGDMFAAEDRHGTWKTILTRSCTRAELFAGKLLAAVAFSVGLVALTAISSLVAGALVVGNRSLVDLSGVLLSPGRSLLLVSASWVLCVAPVLAYTSLAVLLSVATRNGIVGVIGPSLVALVTQLLDLIGRGVWVHMLLIGSAFDGWHGLFTTHRFYGPAAVSTVVSAVWIVACLGAAWLILRRRDFYGTSASRGSGWLTALRVVAGATAVIAVLALAANLGPAGVTAMRLRAAIAPEFSNITLLQQQLIGRTVPAGARFAIVPSCNRHASKPVGPGDWSCTLDVYLPMPGKVPFQQALVTYDVSVQANGCYKAQSPPTFVGQQTMRDSHGQTVVNPLFVVYGCFDTL